MSKSKLIEEANNFINKSGLWDCVENKTIRKNFRNLLLKICKENKIKMTNKRKR